MNIIFYEILNINFVAVLIAALGGILPAVFWLLFFLREDAHPEPRRLIFKSFLYGMAAVPFAITFQFIVSRTLVGDENIISIFFSNLPLAILIIFLWAGAEEYFKYKAAYESGIKTRDNDEPVDVMIYTITAALGFAALENTLYILWPIIDGNSTAAFIQGNLRFIGATMLHVATSAIIGIFASLSFYKSKTIKKEYVFVGFIISVILHTIFNSFIIKAREIEEFTLISFGIVWLSIIFIILFFEKAKQIYINRKINSLNK